ncbi:MAG: hypothetical protein U9N38_04025 [Thermodesulfobacteriota bacterium]|nr:hypothetical protein [Thermodesulfobacteriota bacterium]
MGILIGYLAAHPVVSVIIAVVVLLLIYSFFKGLLKLMFITCLVLIALCGYNYYKAPDDFPGNVRKIAARVGDYIDDMMKAGKNIIGKGTDMVEEGENLIDKIGESVKKKSFHSD